MFMKSGSFFLHRLTWAKIRGRGLLADMTKKRPKRNPLDDVSCSLNSLKGII